MNKEDIKVRFNNGILTISGEKKSVLEQGDPDSRFHRKESRSGSFSRSVALPDDASQNLTAKYENGVLKICVRKLPEEQKPGQEIKVMHTLWLPLLMRTNLD
jgi:HSP20 family protein